MRVPLEYLSWEPPKRLAMIRPDGHPAVESHGNQTKDGKKDDETAIYA